MAPRGRPKRGRGRGRNRWGGYRGPHKKPEPEENNQSTSLANESMNEDEEEDEELIDESAKGDTSQSDNNETIDEKPEDTPTKKEPGRRGRKRKAELPVPEVVTPPSESPQRGILASGGSLRRRDTLKSTSRYSPPPVITRKQKLEKDKSASGENKKYVYPDSNEDTLVTRRRSQIAIKSTDANAGIKIKSDTREKELAVGKPDGLDQTKAETSRKVAEKPVVEVTEQKQEAEKKEPEPTPKSDVVVVAPSKTNDDKVVDETTTNEDKSIVGRVLRRKSTETNTNSVTSADKLKSPVVRITAADKATPPKVTGMESPVKTTVPINTINTSVTQSDTRVVTISTNTTSISVTKMSTPTTSFSTTNLPTAKLPIILKTPITNSSVLTKAPRKPSSLNKYLETLPEIEDCIHHDGIPDDDMEKMPDKILLVHSELPLPLSVSIDNDNENYLFRQIISPVTSVRYVCLLCKGIDVAFGTKEEKDIILHYQSLHELDVEIGQAKFSQDIVYICLPKMVLNQFNNSSNLSLNSPCQYCDIRLSDIGEMKVHYSDEHQKSVIMMEQEEIMQMHHFFYCSKCKVQSPDFDTHHKHMKKEHNLKTYRCKSCVLVTKDENRLRTHYKAKHMLHNAGQNYQCFYCHGLLIGVERLQKHIQQSHMVQTGPSEFSCMACRRSCGKGKELLIHAQNCSLAGIKPEKSDVRFMPIGEPPEEITEDERICFFCNVKLESEEAYQLHLHHEHKIWVPSSGSPVISAAAAAANVDKTEATDKEEFADKKKLLTIKDTISDEDLERAKIQTYVGHWCRICDQMVKVYQLFYLHMVNYHKYEKVYQCVITSCKKQFKEFPEFMQHIEESGHSQKTIITHPDEVFVCSYCDIYFANDPELIAHLITDQHINKFTASGHFHRTEPRNFKCKACHTFFGMKESYIHHLETESHQYVCTYCGITTATPSSRRAHIQNSHAHKLLLCEECGEPQEDIMAHFVVHGYAFECKKCIKKFYNRERLNAHMEVHQDAIACNWPDCTLEKPIATRSMLVTHYRGHKSEHKCNECGLAFWNFSMLTSHQRSHQPMPRLPQNPPKVNQHKASVQYTNQKHPAVLKPRHSTQPMLANSVIKCGHCSCLFRTTAELDAHHCIAKSNLNNGKMTELASKAAGQKPSKPPSRRRASPKKQSHQGVDPSSDNAQYTNSISETGDEDTQLIMILNQTTGELMEITAPKNMEVQDVIRSLDFTPAMEDVSMEAIEQHQPTPPTQQTVAMEIAPEQEVQEPILVDKEKEEEAVVQDETAVAIEMMEQQIQNETLPEDVVNSTNVVVTETVVDPVVATTVVTDSETIVTTPSIDTSAPTEVAMPVNNGEQITEMLDQDDANSQEHAIVLPPNCLNADGSLTLDAETLQRLNLAISMDENGTITTQDGNATFIIDTSS